MNRDLNSRSNQNQRPRQSRRGAIIVWTSLILLTMIGMVGLVVDSGLMLASFRHSQNSADAAAMAAAMDMLNGKSNADAIATGQTFVTTCAAHNSLANATVTINIPPVSGPYAGSSNHAEAIVSSPMPTYFIHALPGVSQGHTTNARAVAGFEPVAVGEGVIALNPNATPGLNVTGNGNLVVDGTVLVNSTGGGVDENGNSVGGGQNGAKATNNSTVQANQILISGGVNDGTTSPATHRAPTSWTPILRRSIPIRSIPCRRQRPATACSTLIGVRHRRRAGVWHLIIPTTPMTYWVADRILSKIRVRQMRPWCCIRESISRSRSPAAKCGSSPGFMF